LGDLLLKLFQQLFLLACLNNYLNSQTRNQAQEEQSLSTTADAAKEDRFTSLSPMHTIMRSRNKQHLEETVKKINPDHHVTETTILDIVNFILQAELHLTVLHCKWF